MLLNREQIKDYIPHREPFLFVDEVIEIIDQEKIVAKKVFTDKQDFFAGHFPDFPVVPGVIITESLAQSGGILVNYSYGDEIKREGYSNALLTSLNNCKFRKPVLPNQELILEVEIVRKRKMLLFFKGTASVYGKKVAEADISASLI